MSTPQCSAPVVKSVNIPVYTPVTPTPTPTPTPTVNKPGIPGTPYQTVVSVYGTEYDVNLTINWSLADGATSYSVIDPDSGQILAEGLPSGPFTALNLYAGATIHLAIRAYNSAGYTQSGTATFVLPCPAGYTSTGEECVQNKLLAPYASDCSSQYSSDRTSEVDLCWSWVNGAASYVVRDSRGFGGGLSGAGYNVGNTTLAHLTEVPPGTTVQAQVAAVDSNGNVGEWSDIILMTTQQAQVAANMYISNVNIAEIYPGVNVNAAVYVTNSGNEDGITIVSGDIYWAGGGTCGDTSTTQVAAHFVSSSAVIIPAGRTVIVDLTSEGPVAACYVNAAFKMCFTISGGQPYCRTQYVLD